MPSNPIIVVTGASRGVGLGIAKRLLASETPYSLYLTSRSGDQLPSTSGKVTAHPCKLDIADVESVKAFADHVERDNGKKSIDVLINNAGINLDQDSPYSKERVQRTLQTNYYGTVNMCDAFLPLLKPGGRIVNVASVAGHLKMYPKAVQQKFRSSAESLQDVDQLLKEYESLVEQGIDRSSGWPEQSYSVSKCFLIAYTKALATAHPEHLINSCCPGWVNTDMGKLIGRPPKSIEDGATIPLRLAIEDIGGASGVFWENDSVYSTDNGKISAW